MLPQHLFKMEYWKKYNKKLNDFAILMHEHNQENEFNFIENNFYNHIRDLVALSISMLQLNSKTPVKILDYGSNATAWANIYRKINTDSIEVTVFDHEGQTEWIESILKDIKNALDQNEIPPRSESCGYCLHSEQVSYLNLF